MGTGQHRKLLLGLDSTTLDKNQTGADSSSLAETIALSTFSAEGLPSEGLVCGIHQLGDFADCD
jgi:hypothetical protein